MERMHLPEKALVIALDHAQTLGVVEGLENPGQVLDEVIAAGADGIMTSYGVVKKFGPQIFGRVPTFLRLDGGPSMYKEDWLKYTEWSLLHSVEDARALGVDGVCVMCFIGGPVELRTFEIVSRVASACRADGLPVMVEALPCLDLQRIPKPLSPDAMASAARIAFEHGADIVKTYYTGTPEGFRKVPETVRCQHLSPAGPRWIPSAPPWRSSTAPCWAAPKVSSSGAIFGRVRMRLAPFRPSAPSFTLELPSIRPCKNMSPD